jgi:hypothetical protein
MKASSDIDPRPARAGPSNREKHLSVLLLAVLGLIALAMVLAQFRYDPGQWRAQSDEMAAGMDILGLTDEAVAALERSAVPAGLQPMTPPEYFGADTLSDKIDGKAELYLPAGFRFLESRRLSLADDPGLWVERFVYDMGVHSNAFSVYSQQRREAARALNLTPDAYQAANGIFFVHGNYYVEIIGSDPSERLIDKMIDLARAFVEEHPVVAAAHDERGLLPETDRIADSLTLTASNAFGFEGFDQIYSARYERDGQVAMAYVSRRASAAEAARLVEDYTEFLLTYGGRPIDAPDGAPPVWIVETMGYLSIVFNHADLVAGVHEAEDLEFGLALATQLYHQLSEE